VTQLRTRAPFLTYRLLWQNGRLGNQLWQVASTIGLAHQSGIEPRFPRWEYEPYFQVPQELFVDRLPELCYDLGADYLQELRHFEPIKNQIWEWFQPSDRALAALERPMRRLSTQLGGAVGLRHLTAVHVRRGDYLNLPSHFPPLSMTYYLRAMAQVRGEHPDTTFVVFSDDADWCRANFPEDCLVIDGVPRPVELADRVGEPEDQEDLFLYLFCDRHIIANSTFGWWGAWLSLDEAPLYPSTWFGPALAHIPWRAMFDRRWVEIPC
jgi:Glycosyl transferase family 11